MNPFEFDWAQQLVAAFRAPGPVWFGRRLWPGYRLPTCDANGARRLDLTHAGALADCPFRPELLADEVALIGDPVPWPAYDEHAGGLPLQLGHPTNRVLVTETHPDYPRREIQIPAPEGGWLWVEGNPWPAWRMATASYDCHARIIWPADGASWEMIGAVPHRQWGQLTTITCRALARYDADGNLDRRDRPVTRAPVQHSSLLLGRTEPPHRLSLAIRGDDNNPDTLGEIGRWVALDRDRVPWDELTADAHRVATMLCSFGALTVDHSGRTGLPATAGAQWAGVSWGGWRPRLADFREVIGEGL